MQAVTREEALDLCENMVLGRNFEDMCMQMQYRGKMFAFVYLSLQTEFHFELEEDMIYPGLKVLFPPCSVVLPSTFL